MRVFILYALAISIPLCAAEDKLQPVDAATVALDKAMAPSLLEARKVMDKYKKDIQGIAEKAIKDVEKVKFDAMKKGDLALANIADNRIKDLKSGKFTDVIAASSQSDDLLSDGLPVSFSANGFTSTNVSGKLGAYTIGADVTDLLSAVREKDGFRIKGNYDDGIAKSQHLGKVIFSPLVDVASLPSCQFKIVQKQGQGGNDHIYYNVIGQNADTITYFGVGFGAPSSGNATVRFKVTGGSLTILLDGASVGEFKVDSKVKIGVGVTTRFAGDMIDTLVTPGMATGKK